MKTNIEVSSLTLLPSCPLFHISFFGTMICSAIPLANLEATCLFSSLLLGSSVLNHVWPFATPWTVAHKAPLSMGFPRQEYWSGLPLPSPGDKHDPGIKLVSPASAGRVLTKTMAYSSHVADTGSKIDLFAGMVLEQIGNSPPITGAWFLASTYPFKSNLPSSRQVCSSSSSSLPSMPNLAHKKASNHRTRHFFPLTIFNTISLGEITTVKSFKEVPC